MTTIHLNTIDHDEALEMMISGFETQLAKINGQIAEVNMMLKGGELPKGRFKSTSVDVPKAKRYVSPATKAKIKAKLKLAWKKRKAEAAKVAKKGKK